MFVFILFCLFFFSGAFTRAFLSCNICTHNAIVVFVVHHWFIIQLHSTSVLLFRGLMLQTRTHMINNSEHYGLVVVFADFSYFMIVFQN